MLNRCCWPTRLNMQPNNVATRRAISFWGACTIRSCRQRFVPPVFLQYTIKNCAFATFDGTKTKTRADINAFDSNWLNHMDVEQQKISLKQQDFQGCTFNSSGRSKGSLGRMARYTPASNRKNLGWAVILRLARLVNTGSLRPKKRSSRI